MCVRVWRTRERRRAKSKVPQEQIERGGARGVCSEWLRSDVVACWGGWYWAGLAVASGDEHSVFSPFARRGRSLCVLCCLLKRRGRLCALARPQKVVLQSCEMRQKPHKYSRLRRATGRPRRTDRWPTFGCEMPKILRLHGCLRTMTLAMTIRGKY